MHRALLLVALTAALICLGMTSRDANEIPSPEKDFSVTITDREGVVTEASQVSVEGDVFLTTLRGEAKFYVPFEKMERIQFGELEGNMVRADILLRSGRTAEVRIRRNLRCFGETEFGNFSVRMESLDLILFQSDKDSSSPS